MENLEMIKPAEDIILKVFLQRHGPKLSASGEKNDLAPYFRAAVEEGFADLDVEGGKGLVHISSSKIKRALDTADIVQEKVAATEHRGKEVIGQEEVLTAPFRPEGEATDKKYSEDLEKILKIQADFEPAIREKVKREYPGLAEEEEEVQVRDLVDREVLNILFDEEKRKASGLQTSYEELADIMASRYKGFLAHAGFLATRREEEEKKSEEERQPKDEPYIQIDVSHSFKIMSLLKKYLVFDDGAAAEEMAADDFFVRTGGVIGESGHLEMDYELEGDNYVVKVKGGFSPQSNFSGRLNFSEQYEEKK